MAPLVKKSLSHDEAQRLADHPAMSRSWNGRDERSIQLTEAAPHAHIATHVGSGYWLDTEFLKEGSPWRVAADAAIRETFPEVIL